MSQQEVSRTGASNAPDFRPEHGFARVFTGTHISGFAQGMVKSMAGTPLPPELFS